MGPALARTPFFNKNSKNSPIYRWWDELHKAWKHVMRYFWIPDILLIIDAFDPAFRMDKE
jgi:hypothetical protein